MVFKIFSDLFLAKRLFSHFDSLSAHDDNAFVNPPDYLPDQIMEGELAAFLSYAKAFPQSFLALIDTYDVIK